MILYLWEFPQNLLGGLLLFILKRRIRESVRYKESRIYYALKFPGGISLAGKIFLNLHLHGDKKSVMHEYGHRRQSIFLGWFYLPVVGIPSLARSLIWKLFKLDSKKYYAGYPENWAERLGS